ncbi:uncharacterized protein KIAA0825-like isoform X2 [Dreissena polymorpha]|uniref:Uncharacterized protein n=1 Tax=Dreissena polymorpha TaxID=45954 RepID=A0A9D4K7C3_DREPO|nr:uncharacterized protein KIAA0825-like isoform X2 [Dreissena polymorpha]KAH3834366.1 hypothetical protein DPMN_107688 [Dreissena polymorpha]
MASSLQFRECAPPMENLLANGVPSIAAMETYIADLDIDLEENAKELDACLQEMLQLTNTIVGKEYVTPRDALLSMLSLRTLENDSCYDPETDAITDILNHAWKMLDAVPGSEEAVFQDLLSLSSQQGLSLPLRAAVVDPIASTMSLNTVSDSSEIHIAQQWDQIAFRLRRFFIDRLSLLPVGPMEPAVNIYERRRLKYVQALITLQPIEEVWEKYHAVRVQQLEKCLSRLIPESEAVPADILQVSSNCSEIAQIIARMMSEDFVTLTSGVVKKASKIFQAFQKSYLEKYSDEMSALVDEVVDELQDSSGKGPVKGLTKEGSLRKSKSKQDMNGKLKSAQSVESVDNMVDRLSTGNVQKLIPVKYIKVILNIVTTLQQIEDHLDGLQRATVWDFGGISTKKSHRKGSLKGVLKPSSSPELMRRPASATLSIDSDTWTPDSLLASCVSTSSVTFEQPPGPRVQVVEKMKAEEKIHWHWRIIFKKVAPDLAASITHQIQSTCQAGMEAEQNMWSTQQTLEVVDVPESLIGGRLDYPRCISKCTWEIMSVVESYLILGRAGVEGYLHPVRTAFVEATNVGLKNMHADILKMSSDVPLQSPMKNLYVLLSSAAFIRNHLLHFDTILAPEESKKPFSVLYKQFVELVETLTEQVIQRHGNYIASSVLHDTDSHNWTENKEFYEGERCSFTVQMWNYYLQGVHHDMWTICPPKLAQSSLAVILHDSLQLLTQRYTHCKPSFRRVGQFRCDIMTILLCASEMLYWCSGSISRVIDPGHTQGPHYSIHNLCTALLSAMAVIAAPLDVLYKVNKKGYRYRQKRKSISQADRGFNSYWLSWVQPSMMDKHVKCYNDMRTTVAVYLNTKLLLRQPELNFPLTIQAYFMKDYTLSILFITQTISENGSQTETQVSGNQSDLTNSPEKVFMMSLFRVLTTASGFTDGLCKVVVPLLERSHGWVCLDARHVPGRDVPIPLWMECVMECMKPFVHRVLKPLLDFVLTQADSKQITPISTVTEELPCGCRSHATTTPRSARKAEGSKDTVEVVLKMTLTQITEDMFVLPSSVLVLFRILEQQCASKGLKTPHHCVGIKLIALSLREYLLNASQMSQDLQCSLNQPIRDEFKLLADCVYHVLVSGKVKGSSTPRSAGRFCKDNKDWINEKIQILVTYLSSEIFDESSNLLLQDASTEFQDQLYMSLTSDLLATTHGLEDLKRLYWLLSNNEEWLHKQLDIKHGLMLAQPFTERLKFTLDMTPRPITSDFNPITAHQRIGPYKFDHAAIECLPVDWERLLQSDLGLSELGFRTLLYNRHEMQDGAYLEDTEKKPVAALRAVFENDPRELR